jgi:hypothetical protein
VTNDEEDIVTTTIMHFGTFNPKIMDSRTGASGLEDESVNQPHEERYGKDSRQPVRSAGVNDGDTDQPRVSIHDL